MSNKQRVPGGCLTLWKDDPIWWGSYLWHGQSQCRVVFHFVLLGWSSATCVEASFPVKIHAVSWWKTPPRMESILTLLWVLSMEQKNPPVSQVVYPNTRNWYVPGSQFHVNFSTPEDVFWFPLFSQVSFLPCRWQVGHEHLQLSEPITGSVVFRCSEDFQREKPLGKPSWKWDENEHIYIYIHIKHINI